MYWPADTLDVSNMALEAKRVAHPCSSLKNTVLIAILQYNTYYLLILQNIVSFLQKILLQDYLPFSQNWLYVQNQNEFKRRVFKMACK